MSPAAQDRLAEGSQELIRQGRRRKISARHYLVRVMEHVSADMMDSTRLERAWADIL
jgi:hypothetical protein